MLEQFVLKIKRADTPFYRALKNIAKGVMLSTLPLPRFLHPLLGLLFNLQAGVVGGFRWAFSYFWREPLFRGRCVSIGKRFRLTRMPFIMSHAKIYIGDDVNFFGKVDIQSGRIFDEPKLIIGNRVDIGHLVIFLVKRVPSKVPKAF